MKKYLLNGGLIASGSVMAMNVAHAALPAGIATGLTAIQTDVGDLADLVWPVVLFVFGSLIVFKLFKRFGNKI